MSTWSPPAGGHGHQRTSSASRLGRHALAPLVGLLDEVLEGTDVDGLVGTDDPLQPELWASWLVGTWRTRVPLLAPILHELDIDPDRDIGGPLVAADILGPALEATDAWPGAPVPEDVWRLRALLGARLRALPCPAPAAGGWQVLARGEAEGAIVRVMADEARSVEAQVVRYARWMEERGPPADPDTARLLLQYRAD